MELFDKYMTVTDACKEWDLSSSRIKDLCREEKLKAIKFRNAWLIERNQPNPKQKA